MYFDDTQNPIDVGSVILAQAPGCQVHLSVCHPQKHKTMLADAEAVGVVAALASRAILQNDARLAAMTVDIHLQCMHCIRS